MYRRLAEIGAVLPRRDGLVLAISDSLPLAAHLDLTPDDFVETTYPEQNFLALEFADASFDFVLSDQILEHLDGDPQRAIDESWRVLRPGGIAVHTTCFVNPIHGHPDDFWRFSPAALRLLCRRFSRVIACEGWGNFEAWLLIRDGLRYQPVPHATWHPLHRVATRNDPAWPIHTWIVAQK